MIRMLRNMGHAKALDFMKAYNEGAQFVQEQAGAALENAEGRVQGLSDAVSGTNSAMQAQLDEIQNSIQETQ